MFKVNLKKEILSNEGSYYETNYTFECKNSKIMLIDNSWIYLKVDTDLFTNLFTNLKLKKEIVKVMRRSPELYCDCKKIIKVKDTFEEVIKVKNNFNENNNFNVNENNNVNVELLLYGIWFDKSSYGPMIKVIKMDPFENTKIGFIPDTECTDSDEEISYSLKRFKN